MTGVAGVERILRMPLRYFLLLGLLAEKSGGMTCGELAKQLKLTAAGLTGIKDALVKDGYVRESRLPSDRREVRLYPTARCRLWLTSLHPVLSETEKFLKSLENEIAP